MTFLNKILAWQLEYFLNEKRWEFSLTSGYDRFLEKINNEVALLKKPYNNGASVAKGKLFYGYIDKNILTLEITKKKSRLNLLKTTYFYFSGKICLKENILKGSFHTHNHFRFMNLFFLNAFFIQSIIYIAHSIYKLLLTGSLVTSSVFTLIEIGGFFLLIVIVIESKINHFFSRHEEEQIYKLLVHLTR